MQICDRIPIYLCTPYGIIDWKEQKMIVFEYILLAILLVCSAVIVLAVVFQKSNEGLSGTIAGGSDSYYNKDKSADKDKKIFRITLVAIIVFAIAVLAAYILQPDYSSYVYNDWQSLSEYSSVFK